MYVTPKISAEEAQDIISRRTPFFCIRIWKSSISPKRIEMIYLPYYWLEILLTGKAENQKVAISVDGLLGTTAFFSEDGLSYVPKTDNLACDFGLSPAEAQKIATEEYNGFVLEHSFMSRKVSSIKEILQVKQIFYPFWVGYFQRGKAYDFKAVDAVSGEVQGIKMRRVFLKAFRQVTGGL